MCSQTQHPTPETLQSFALGKLDDASAEVISKHLEDCPDCRQQVSEMGPDSFLGRLRDTQEKNEMSVARQGVPGTRQTGATATDDSQASSSSPAMSSTGDADATSDALNGPDEKSFPSGTRVGYFGDYELLNVLGEGGMGTVYKARQLSLNRLVALKMIKATRFPSSAELRRFQNEAEAVALLDHPSIVPVYEVGEHDSQRYISMKLIEGGNLAEQLGSFQDDPKAAVSLMIEIAKAIQHAHMRGILHRDLKPANVLVDAKGHPHITDFGLAKRVGADVEMTASGAIVGTPAYMSPEQASRRRGTTTTATDIYGVGAIFYALLTGKAPFGGESVIETLDAVRSRPPVSPTKLNPKIPRDLELICLICLICLKCLEKDPAERYSAGSLASDLGRFTAGEPVSVRAAGAVERVAKWARRKPTLAAAYALGLLTLLFGGLGGVAIWQWRAAATAREALAQVEYGRTIQVALQAWRENNVPAALNLLDSTRPDLRGWEWRYVHRLCHSDLVTLKVHMVPPLFSPDGSRIVAFGKDGTAKVWDAKTGAELCTLKGHTHGVFSASFSPDGSRIVAAGYDKYDKKVAKVGDTRTRVEELSLTGHTDRIISASFSPDGSRIVTASVDGRLKVWDPTTGTEVLSLNGHTGVDWSASFSPDGSRIGTSSKDGTAKVWDATPISREFLETGHAPPTETVN